MALTITPIPDGEAHLGVGYVKKLFSLQPGLSDYPTGGYPITAAELGLGNLFGGDQIGVNTAGELYATNVVLSGYPTTAAPDSTVFFEVNSGASQVSAGTNLNAVTWIVEFTAAGE